jgi:Zn-dependent protease with chaperone function
VLVFITPVIIDPLFNKFEPLNAAHPELVSAMESVVQRAGMNIPRERMFLMHASEKSRQINAYVTGIGASQRVVVWDNTIRNTSLPETLFVFGHEMGHYVLHHIRNGFILSVVFLLVLLFAGFHALHWVLGRWGGLWGIYGPEDLASLPVILLLLYATLFLCSPIINAYSRYEEHQADVYGLEVIHGIVPNSSEVAMHAFQVLGEIDLADPNPPAFIAFWLYSHPPLADRLVFARNYDPWSKGESPQFIK